MCLSSKGLYGSSRGCRNSALNISHGIMQATPPHDLWQHTGHDDLVFVSSLFQSIKLQKTIRMQKIFRERRLKSPVALTFAL